MSSSSGEHRGGGSSGGRRNGSRAGRGGGGRPSGRKSNNNDVGSNTSAVNNGNNTTNSSSSGSNNNNYSTAGSGGGGGRGGGRGRNSPREHGGGRWNRSISNNNKKNSNNNNSSNNLNNHRNQQSLGSGGTSQSGVVSGTSGMVEMNSSNNNKSDNRFERDEDVLIAFMPYVKSNDFNAIKIHEQYQNTNDIDAFLKSARMYLLNQNHNQNQNQPNITKLSVASTKADDLQFNQQNQQQSSTSVDTLQESHQQRQQQASQPNLTLLPVAEHPPFGVFTGYDPTTASIIAPPPAPAPAPPTKTETQHDLFPSGTMLPLFSPYGDNSNANNNNQFLQEHRSKFLGELPWEQNHSHAEPIIYQNRYVSSNGNNDNNNNNNNNNSNLLDNSTPIIGLGPMQDALGSLYIDNNSRADVNYNNKNHHLMTQSDVHPPLRQQPTSMQMKSPNTNAFNGGDVIWGGSTTFIGTSSPITPPRNNNISNNNFSSTGSSTLRNIDPFPPCTSPQLYPNAPTTPSSQWNLNLPYQQQHQQQLQQQHHLLEQQQQQPNQSQTSLKNNQIYHHQQQATTNNNNNDEVTMLPTTLFSIAPLTASITTPSLVDQIRFESMKNNIIAETSTGLNLLSNDLNLPCPRPEQVMSSDSNIVAPPTPTPTTSANNNITTPSTPQAQPQLPKKDLYAPKRLWTHPEQQIGSIAVNGITGAVDMSVALSLGPREEVTAHWSIPVRYLIHHDSEMKKKISENTKCTSTTEPFQLEIALKELTIGLFRRGCTENGSQASIISKEVSGFEYYHDPVAEAIRGRVPFFSPRTPGNVIFRMYWENEHLYTLGIGPTLRVRVLENEFENSVRFILSNFKGRKSNPTSLSSLLSLASILETQLSPRNRYEAAARATFGCIQESRKVIDACFQDYNKTLARLAELENELEEVKKSSQVPSDDDYRTNTKEPLVDDNGTIVGTAEKIDSVGLLTVDEVIAETGIESSAIVTILPISNDKLRSVLAGKASCERKWRDAQLAFASILNAILSNPSIGSILRRDMVAKINLEYELWCPLVEEFATPARASGSNPTKAVATSDRMTVPTITWYEALDQLHSTNQCNVSTDDFRLFNQIRCNMQTQTLGFEVNRMPLHDLLYLPNDGSIDNKKSNQKNHPRHQNQRTIDPDAVNTLNTLSAAMGQYYQDLHSDEEKVVRQRESIRLYTQKCVHECGAFPPGTEVVIFGSSANGFGSPQSDIDMCLQLPEGSTLLGKIREKDDNSDDDTPSPGVLAMAKLAEYLMEKSDVKNVDTVRLTARIPIVKYYCPAMNGSNEKDEDILVECDLSMHNPLSVLNTSLLRCYAEITPITRVLMATIKRWAKARDINSPAKHTLSSYGYTIMLLHFLTYHKRTGTGILTIVATPDGLSQMDQNRLTQSSSNQMTTQNANPILPNLHWMDPSWVQDAIAGVPYRELSALPRRFIQHPLKDTTMVNTYFYRTNSPNEKATLQRLFNGQDLSLAIMLASFFRYYAYEFDYKRHVVSLHSTASRGIVEREVKAELDGWRNYTASLTIEDPFELDYDIAHVLRGGNFHRIRREFALAYTKIGDAASGGRQRRSSSSWHTKGDLRSCSGVELLDWICEQVIVLEDTS